MEISQGLAKQKQASQLPTKRQDKQFPVNKLVWQKPRLIELSIRGTKGGAVAGFEGGGGTFGSTTPPVGAS